MRLLLFVSLAAVASAQVSSSVFTGMVKDPSGAVVPGAVVTARHEGTGFSRGTVTAGDGSYRIGELMPGPYSVSVSKPGFRLVTAQHAVVEVNQVARLDFNLALGGPHEAVTVEGAVSPVQSENAGEGYLLQAPTLLGLPLEQRNVVSLVTLGPGAIPRQLGGFTHDVINDIQANRGATALNPPINGSRSTMNVHLLDGAYDTDRNTFAISVLPPMESVQEFRIQSSLASAEFAQGGGGVVNLVSKSGTRDFHGSAFEFLRNEATDARNFFDDSSLPRSVFRQNQFGASIGGPVPLPSTFFFATYEGLRGQSAKPSPNIVPDAATRGGDFSAANPLFDPLSLDPATGARLPFAGNVIPANRIDPIAQKYLNLYEPLPNAAGANNYIDTTPNESSTDNVSGRIDHQFRNSGQLFTRYTINDERGLLAGNFPERPASERLRAQQAGLGYTRTWAHWLADSRVSFTRLRVFDVPESAFQTDVASQLGLSGPSTDPFQFGLPFFQVNNYTTVTDSPTLPQTQRDNTWQVSQAVSFSRGKHTWKFGFEWVHFQFNYLQSSLARGRYDFTGAFTAQPGSTAQTGDPFADFLLGFPQDTTRSVGSTQAYLRQNSYAGYVQQDWRVNGRLTLNLGVRYEYASPYSEAHGSLLNLDYSTVPAAPTLVPFTTPVAPDRNNFAPRAGFALRLPFAVFRGGYGIYYNPEIAVESYDLALNRVRNEINQTDGSKAPVLTLANGFPKTASTGFPSYFGLDPNARTPYVQQWNAGFQRELPGRILAEVSYIGSKGTKLGRFRQFNTPQHVETGENLPPRPGDLQSLRTFPSLGGIIQRQHIANSSYNSLQLKAEKRLGARVMFLASFVWSKSIDDADSIVPGLFDSFGAQDERNLRLERGLSFFNSGRRISGGFVWNLPGSRSFRSAFRNWELSGIVTLQDGTPLNPVYFTYDGANSGTPNRPDVVPGQSVALPRSVRTADQFFNTAAFATPAPYTFGNAGRDILPGPGNNLFDLALHRRFPITEAASVEFRAEAFNAFNHPNWGLPGSYPDFGPFFGKVFSSGDPRRFQFGMRLGF